MPDKMDWAPVSPVFRGGADIACGGDRGEEQALAAAVQHQNFAFGIDGAGQMEAGRKPACGRPPERLDALGDGIAAEIGDMFGQHRADKVWNGMLRLAQ